MAYGETDFVRTVWKEQEQSEDAEERCTADLVVQSQSDPDAQERGTPDLLEQRKTECGASCLPQSEKEKVSPWFFWSKRGVVRGQDCLDLP
jgi:hypothetical protein